MGIFGGSPSEEEKNLKKSLYQSVYSEANLFSAWRHVKKSALNSSNKEIRGQASEFEHKHQTHIRRIIRQLRDQRYLFSPVEGVLKDKEKRLKAGKNPRPVAIARMEDRVVQRAMLQVLQPRRILDPTDPNSKAELISDPRLGAINDFNRSKFGVGGLLRPYGGTERAVSLLMDAMKAGAKHFFQSDIKAFFTDIPVANVVEIVMRETGDRDFCNLFDKALRIELANPDELKTYANLFPKDGRGVAQGGSLSAFSGNALLYDFDHALNTKGITSVRYIDDIIILANEKERLGAAVEFAKRELHKFGFSLYSPDKKLGKADEGLCANSFNFLGCTIQPNRCVPSSASVSGKKGQFSALVHESRNAMSAHLKQGKPFDPSLSQSAVVKRIGEQLYGWEKSFSFCTDTQEFQSIDDHVSRLCIDYTQTVTRTLHKLDQQTAARILGLPSALDQYVKDRRKRSAREAEAAN